MDNEVVTPGIVLGGTFLGEKIEYVVDAGGAILEAVSRDSLRHGLLEIGARVRVSCDPQALRPLAPDGDPPPGASA